MKFVVTICLLLVSALSVASATQRSNRNAPLTRAQVKEAERGLSELGYWTGPVDGVSDSDTQLALVTFQKWEGRRITGRLTRAELNAIRNATSPRPKDTGYKHVEVDLDRQVL